MKIIGAGMAGMLAGQFFRSFTPIIFERQSELPNNHSALLRFRTSAVSVLTNIPFREVKVSKAISFLGIQHTEGNILLNNLYSHKVTGVYQTRSLVNVNNVVRYIAPPDFIQLLSNGLDIYYNTKCTIDTFGEMPVISTMPVQSLAMILKYDLKTILVRRPIWTLRFDIDVPADLYQTIYYPNPNIDLYRLSITGRTVIAEYVAEPDKEPLTEVLHHLSVDFGLMGLSIPREVTIKRQGNGKLVECDGNQVKDFIVWATRHYNVYSLGRWGTHRQLLMDDIVDDLVVIAKLMASEGYVT